MTIDGVAEYPQYADDPSSTTDDQGDPMWTLGMESIDTLLLGRTTYEKWAAFWPGRKTDPSSSAWQKSFSVFADRTVKVVFSKTLPQARWQNSRIVRGDPAEEIARLKSLPGKSIALAGGPKLAQSFLDRDLIDEMFLEIQPSIVGRGKPLFRVLGNPDNPEDVIPLGSPGRHDFKLVESKAYKDGTLFLRYRRAGSL